MNVWGYRGSVMNQKAPREIRIAMVGGDLAYGWGVAAVETLPYFLRFLLSLDVRHTEPPIAVTAVNLSARGMDAGEIPPWLDRFAYLRPDIVCVLPDAASHVPHRDRFLPDRRSRVFNTFGYSPILPLVVQEKASMTGSSALAVAGTALEKLDPLGGNVPAPPAGDRTQAISAAVQAALRAAAIGVVLILPPDDRVPAAVAIADPRVRIVDLAQVPAMHDPALRLDGYHFSVAGHSRAADAVAPAVIDLVHAGREGRR